MVDELELLNIGAKLTDLSVGHTSIIYRFPLSLRTVSLGDFHPGKYIYKIYPLSNNL